MAFNSAPQLCFLDDTYLNHFQVSAPVSETKPFVSTNPLSNNFKMSAFLGQKDSRWLQLEICREFQRNKCSRNDGECKFAHPPANVEVQSGKVTACYDSIKGRCNRDKPPCKYFHPPQHLKDQLLVNGRNHLALKNAVLQQYGLYGHQQRQTITPCLYTTPMIPQYCSSMVTFPANHMMQPNTPQCISMVRAGELTPGLGGAGGVLPHRLVQGFATPQAMSYHQDQGLYTLGSSQFHQMCKTPTSMAAPVLTGIPFSALGSDHGSKKRSRENPSDEANLTLSTLLPLKRPANDQYGAPVFYPSQPTSDESVQVPEIPCESVLTLPRPGHDDFNHQTPVSAVVAYQHALLQIQQQQQLTHSHDIKSEMAGRYQ